MPKAHPTSSPPTRDRPTVFLTGASSGIGLAIAKALTADGYAVWGTSRSPSKLPTLPHFTPVQMDLLEDHSVHTAFRTAEQEAQGFDLLINNAGSSVFGATEAVSASLERSQYQVLLHAPMELIRLALPTMLSRNRGTLLNITSLAGSFPIPFMGAYSAAKAALSAQTTCLRSELAHTPIRVLEVRPADIQTDFHASTQRIGSTTPRLDAVWKVQQREMAAAPPPEHVARAIVRLLHSSTPPPILTVGGFSQAHMAPLLARLVPTRWLLWGMHKYFGL